jgi:hypothetical protein
MRSTAGDVLLKPVLPADLRLLAERILGASARLKGGTTAAVAL